MEDEAEKALRQIADRHYDQELKRDGYENIIRYGVSFYKKNCLVAKV